MFNVVGSSFHALCSNRESMFNVVGSSFHALCSNRESMFNVVGSSFHNIMLYAAAEKACLLWLGVHSICFMQQQRKNV